MTRAFEDRPRGNTHCQHCGVAFTVRQRSNRATYCSQACSMAAKGGQLATVQDCPTCGKTFKARKDRNTYCSRECAFEAHRAQPKVKAEPPERMCVVCGGTFSSVYKSATLCSDGCRKEWNRRAFKAQWQSEAKPYQRQCDECGIEYEVKGAYEGRFCSVRCAKKDAKRKRRALKRQAYVEPVNFGEVVKRDGGRCQLCGKKVQMDQQVPHPLSPTLDHVVPLACGGEHSMANAQLAHFICNARKGAGGSGQLRLVG